MVSSNEWKGNSMIKPTDMGRHYINAYLRNLIRDIHERSVSGDFTDVAAAGLLRELLRYAVAVNQAVSPDGSTHAVVNIHYHPDGTIPLNDQNMETEIYNFPYDENPMPKILQLVDRLLDVPECTKEVVLLAFRDSAIKTV